MKKKLTNNKNSKTKYQKWWDKGKDFSLLPFNLNTLLPCIWCPGQLCWGILLCEEIPALPDKNNPLQEPSPNLTLARGMLREEALFG